MMKKIIDHIINIRCVMLRYNPIRHEVGLIRIGNPGPDSPVLVSGNYFHTVKRLIAELSGIDCYLLVADSAGINVWCAAGVCDFNEHKIADAVNSCSIADIVTHRKLILPQLAAVGIDKKKLFEECGFKAVWGPAAMYDIKKFLENDMKAPADMRVARFPMNERWYNAVGMFGVFLVPVLISALVLPKKFRKHLHFIVLMNFINIFTNFIFYEKFPFRYPANNSMFFGVLTYIGIFLYTFLINPAAKVMLKFYLAAAAVINFLVSIDMLGSTPFYKTTIAHWLKNFNNSSMFQPKVNEKCVKCLECLKVCPKGIFEFENKTISVRLERECCECLACVKQCPARAITNINGSYYKEDIKSIPDIDELMR